MTIGWTREAMRGREELTALRTGWGEWLGKFEWNHFATLTFATAPSVDRSRNEFRRWVRRLEAVAQGPVSSFYALEAGGGWNPHFHVLVGRTGGLTSGGVARAWKSGITHVVPYDPALGAAHYVAKDIGNTILEYDIDIRVRTV
jgi:hypothetical protein